MFFIRAGSIMAWLLVGAGVLKFVMAISIIFGSESSDSIIITSKRYLGSRTAGESLDFALMIFAAGIVLGLLVQIAKNSTKKNES